MEYIVVALIAILGLAYFKLKSFFLKAQDNKLVKEDETLRQTESFQKQEIEKLKEKLNSPTQDLTPEEVELFWKENKK